MCRKTMKRATVPMSIIPSTPPTMPPMIASVWFDSTLLLASASGEGDFVPTLLVLTVREAEVVALDRMTPKGVREAVEVNAVRESVVMSGNSGS